MKKRYKFLRTGYKSENGNHTWEMGKWYKYDGKLNMCKSGFHCSKGIYQAFSYVHGEILAQVEVKGRHLVEDDKEVWGQMRIVKSWRWRKKDSVAFAIYAARLVLKNFEEEFPTDDRPRKAIEAAEKYLQYPTIKNRKAAKAAEAAEVAEVAKAAGAAEAGVYKKLDKWMLNHLKELK